MKLHSTIKILLIIPLLVCTQQAVANTEKNILKVAGCSGNGAICTDLATMEAFTKSKVLQHAKAKSGHGKFDYIIQSDALDRVYLFKYNYIDRVMYIENPREQDIEVYQAFATLVSQQELFGERKSQVESLVSGNYATEQAVKYNPNALRTSSGEIPSSIDFDSFCGTTATPERLPHQMQSQCYQTLFSAGLWNDVTKIKRTLTQVSNLSTFYAEGSMQTVVTELKAGASTSVNLEQAKEYTISFGGPIRFTTFNGYSLVLSPSKSGDLFVKRFTIPPNDQSVPVDEDGYLLTDDITEKANNGQYRFDGTSQNFANLMAYSTDSVEWRNLARHIAGGFTCDYCKITDLPLVEKSQE